MAILPKAILFNAIPSIDILHRNRKNRPKFMCNNKRPQIAKAILSKMSDARNTTIFDFKLYYSAIVKE
jgi:hypothetical protein